MNPSEGRGRTGCDGEVLVHYVALLQCQLCPCFLAKHQFGIYNSRLSFVYKSGVSSGSIKSGVVWPIAMESNPLPTEFAS